MKFTEEMLKSYSTPLSDSEDQQCKNAIGMVRDALKELGFSDENKAISKMYENTYAYQLQLKGNGRIVKIFIQGSYANNTNVRTQSDVDIAVVEEDVFRTKYRTGVTEVSYGFTTAASRPKSFKDEVQEVLEKKFGKDIERHDKSIKIHGNSYRKDADSVPCRRYRDYTKDYLNDASNYIGGILINPDSGGEIINYPEQHIANGRQKNVDTNYYYKKMVRIIKKMKYLMEEDNILSAKNVSSFGLESLLWNVPNDCFTEFVNFRLEFNAIISYLYNNKSLITTYKEANGIKDLCSDINQANNYKQFIDDLKKFYNYDI